MNLSSIFNKSGESGASILSSDLGKSIGLTALGTAASNVNLGKIDEKLGIGSLFGSLKRGDIDKLVNLDSKNSDIWKIMMAPAGKFCAPPPYTVGCSIYSSTKLYANELFIPATAFSYSPYSMVEDELDIGNGVSLGLYKGYDLVRKLSITFINDAYDTVPKYLDFYKSLICPSYRTIRPYKECCTLIRILVGNKFGGAIYHYGLLGIPIIPERVINNSDNNTIEVEYNILGKVF